MRNIIVYDLYSTLLRVLLLCPKRDDKKSIGTVHALKTEVKHEKEII